MLQNAWNRIFRSFCSKHKSQSPAMICVRIEIIYPVYTPRSRSHPQSMLVILCHICSMYTCTIAHKYWCTLAVHKLYSMEDCWYCMYEYLHQCCGSDFSNSDPDPGIKKVPYPVSGSQFATLTGTKCKKFHIVQVHLVLWQGPLQGHARKNV